MAQGYRHGIVLGAAQDNEAEFVSDIYEETLF